MRRCGICERYEIGVYLELSELDKDRGGRSGKGGQSLKRSHDHRQRTHRLGGSEDDVFLSSGWSRLYERSRNVVRPG